mgnify:CR=1 FL=1
MRILVFFQGWYGERIANNIGCRSPDWEQVSLRLPKGIPLLPEEEVIEEISREALEEARSALGRRRPDLLLILLEEPGACFLIPELAEGLGPGGLICPVDDYRVMPRGLERQISEELVELGIPFVFPRPFCSLSSGKGPIGVFAERFGRPKLEVELEGGRISDVRVLRGAPCGSTHYAAQRIIGVEASRAPGLAGLSVQIYPCLASHVEDPLLGEDMIHVSASLAKAAVEEAILRAGGEAVRPCR